MTAKVQLYNTKGESLTFVDFWVEKFKRVSRNAEPVLEITDVIRRHGVFNSVTRTTAGTTTVATPDTNGSLLITDILISGEKQAGSTVELLFTDDSQTESLFLVSQVDVPAQVALPIAGRIQGWKNEIGRAHV